MGANTSKSGERETFAAHSDRHRVKELVDFGSLLPNGLYPITKQDYDLRSVRNLIAIRKLAPFYKGLPEPPKPAATPSQECQSLHLSEASFSVDLKMNNEQARKDRDNQKSLVSSSYCNNHDATMYTAADRAQLRQDTLYSNPVECPICFLYYPANINYTRCCDQPLCTECFLQIKRPAEASISAATCPFCMQDNFGVVYSLARKEEPLGVRHTTSGITDATVESRRPSLGHRDLNVVLVDHVRPNWTMLDNTTRAVRAAATNSRRASSTAMRTIPEGYRPTVRFNRSASSATPSEYNHFISAITDMDVDLEDWMFMEAVRRSLAEQESAAQDQNGSRERLYPNTRIHEEQQQQQVQQPQILYFQE